MRIVCIHQGYELYGSDRAFIESVSALRALYPHADIEVVLPRGGPIEAPLSAVASRIVFEPLWILRRRDLKRLATLGVLRMPLALTRAVRRIAGADLAYINTTVIVDYLIAARLVPGKALVHVHEIPEGPALPVLKRLLAFAQADVIFNSQASLAAFGLAPSPRHHVVYNGVAGPAEAQPTTYDGKRQLRVLMLGRINRIKGQEVLIEALERLPAQTREAIEVRIVGSAFEDPEREVTLAALIAQKGMGGRVTLEPFASDPTPLYRWADIVTVPSRRPELLGRVAIEAMAFGRPPLASAIGGLTEVVEDGLTGWLIAPDDAEALAQRLQAIVDEPGHWAAYGKAARARYEALFSEGAAATAIGSIVAGMIARRRTD